MQGTFVGFNTASIILENRFLALLLKVRNNNGICQAYYLQAPMLADLLLILQNRLVSVLKLLEDKGDVYRDELIAYNETLISNMPPIEMNEVQQPSPERRIMSITLKPGETSSTLILVLQDEQIATLRIDDMQVEALAMGIQQALNSSRDEEVIKYLGERLDYLMLYAVDLTTVPNVQYQQHVQDEWKLNLFSHYLAVLYCCDTEEGKKILSGAVIKTSAPHLSQSENDIVMHLVEHSQKLKLVHNVHAPSQIFSKVITAQPETMMGLQECLSSLNIFYKEVKNSLPV